MGIHPFYDEVRVVLNDSTYSLAENPATGRRARPRARPSDRLFLFLARLTLQTPRRQLGDADHKSLKQLFSFWERPRRCEELSCLTTV
jgi:hypothetical protein